MFRKPSLLLVLSPRISLLSRSPCGDTFKELTHVWDIVANSQGLLGDSRIDEREELVASLVVVTLFYCQISEAAQTHPTSIPGPSGE